MMPEGSIAYPGNFQRETRGQDLCRDGGMGCNRADGHIIAGPGWHVKNSPHAPLIHGTCSIDCSIFLLGGCRLADADAALGTEQRTVLTAAGTE